MRWILPIDRVNPDDQSRVGGKATALAALKSEGFPVPDSVCITTDAYHAYLDTTGLRERIQLELHRKEFDHMRWEEIWDCAMRIRNLFLGKPMPLDLADEIASELESRFGDRPVAIRSSAPGEDARQASFAGLHESFINIRGTEAVLDHIRLVWSSLWSDAALLYRKEVGLDLEHSAMGVLVQETLVGERSGVAFTRSPHDEHLGVIEAVYGLNQGLVDGTVQPDRWMVNRESIRILEHTPAERRHMVSAAKSGVSQVALSTDQIHDSPLQPEDVERVFRQALRAEQTFDSPQDVEWTIRGETLYVLQSRPITTWTNQAEGDKRGWYLSLHRSFENLRSLRQRIEHQLIPEMVDIAREMAETDLTRLSDTQLADEIRRRVDINMKWTSVYWADFIPFAHGIRLFGQVYNDTIRPDDPYEFMDLLGATPMASLERNRLLEELAAMVREDRSRMEAYENQETDHVDDAFARKIEAFIEKFGDLSCPVTGGTQCGQGPEALLRIVAEIAAHPPPAKPPARSDDVRQLAQAFLDRFEDEEKDRAADLLDLARASYRLRDDDNIHMGRIEAQLHAAMREARFRLERRHEDELGDDRLSRIVSEINGSETGPNRAVADEQSTRSFRARQLVGQPAGPGICRGKARVIGTSADLADFRYGEVLVCDSVDPNMTFVVPLAAGILERRGGMLIHGAIIAREYGLPCVTGITDATLFIQTGDTVTVDGYLGIVTVEAVEFI